MFDKELAELYGVSTNRLKEQVRRNLKRFPEDFMFELTWEEAAKLSSRPQFAVLKKGQNIKYLPYAFTEQGVAMISSVLHSDRAIEVNIQIMRVFTKLREMMISHKDLREKIEEMEKKYDQKFAVVFEVIKSLMTYPNGAYKKTKVGFIVNPE